MGDKNFNKHSDLMPWNIDITKNGNIRIFNITLGKTRIQDANHILASFAETLLVKNNNDIKLIAVYNELNMGGLIAEIELLYDLDKEKLLELEKVALQDNASNSMHLPKDIEMNLLTTVISGLTYRPAVDFDIDIILQRFGLPAIEDKISDNIEHWQYPDLGLKIIIDKQGLDQFIYSSIKNN